MAELFEERKVRTVWDDEQEKWYFSIVDVCGVLTDSPNPRNYWKVLKHRLVKEGNETVTNCNQLKLKAEDGKMRLTDVADTEQLFRTFQGPVPCHPPHASLPRELRRCLRWSYPQGSCQPQRHHFLVGIRPDQERCSPERRPDS